MNMERGEVGLVNLNPTVGAEMQKTRPTVIVSDNDIGILPLKVVVPITEWKQWQIDMPWMVHVEATAENGLSKTSAADAFQIRSVSRDRFVRKLGRLSDPLMREISEALVLTLSIKDIS
jgi:mRNA interferase MazF